MKLETHCTAPLPRYIAHTHVSRVLCAPVGASHSHVTNELTAGTFHNAKGCLASGEFS